MDNVMFFILGIVCGVGVAVLILAHALYCSKDPF